MEVSEEASCVPEEADGFFVADGVLEEDGFFVAAEPREDFGNHLGGVNAAPDDVAGGKRCRFIRVENLLGAQEKCGCF